MTAEATEAQVAAAMEALRCEPNPFLTGYRGTPVEGSLCSRHPGDWTDRGCPVAVQAADAVVAAGPDPATIAADALRDAAEAIRRTDKTCKVGATCHDADAITLDARADYIEPQP